MHDIFHLIFYPMACISMCYNMSVDEVDAYLFWYPEDEEDDDYEENNEEETCDNEDKETGANAEKNEKERKKHYASKYF